MANWLSVGSTAQKYGITEEEINELIRLRYITSSFIHDEPDIKSEQFVDTDEIEDLLEFNAEYPLPDDETVQRVPIKTLELMKQEKESLQEYSIELLEYIRLHHQRDLELMKCTRELVAVANQVLSLDETIANDIKLAITQRSKHLWRTLCHFFLKR